MPSSTRLADAGAGEQAHALAAADGEHRVDRAHAGVQRRAHRVAVHRVDRAADHRLVARVAAAGPCGRSAGRASRRRGRAGRRPSAGAGRGPRCGARGGSRAPRRGGTCGAGRGTTRAPLARPCISPVGIRKARSPLKPTTSASTGGWRLADAHFAHRADRHAHAGGFEHQAGHAHAGVPSRFQRHAAGGEGLQVGAGSAASARRALVGQLARGSWRRRASCGIASGASPAERQRRRAQRRPARPAPSASRCGRRSRRRRTRPAAAARDAASAISRAPRACQRFGGALRDQRQVIGVHAAPDVARR